MERRDWSLKALERLKYIDSLDHDENKANLLASWVNEYLGGEFSIEDFNLELKDLKILSELFYKNLSFLKELQKDLHLQLNTNKKLKAFLK